MATAVLKVSPKIMDTMKQKYATHIQPKVPQGGVFAAKPPGCTITAYKSGKVLFQGQNAEIEAAKWGTVEEKKSSPKKAASSAFLPTNVSKLSLIGSDEVGTGDYFGPMTVVAAYVQSEQIEHVKALGVQDSKNLKDPQIVSIAQRLIKEIPYALYVLHNEKYNELQAQGMSQGKMKAILHNRALLKVIGKIDNDTCEGILIDQFALPQTYFNYLKGEKNVVKDRVYFSTKGESVHLSVAAASIIARYAFLMEWDKLSQLAGVQLPKGAGSKVDDVAALLIKQHGIDFVKKLTKFHFANTEKAKKLAR
ncbi:ribonuclease HIII [Bacillus sp. FJAT-45350]|uniref:ribonuclease HIII n=1 Tax=Bacillus sp. FJAT-45350 TaxID=2011014 RepID=UPI000BB7EF82|nr:ribonuclease HIII [Bacillus sp. FJAT-45350]